MINTAKSLHFKPNKSLIYTVVIALHALIIFYPTAKDHRINFALSLKKQAVSSLAVRLASKKAVIKPKKLERKMLTKKLVKRAKTPAITEKKTEIIKKVEDQHATKQDVTRNFKQSIQNFTKPNYPRIARMRRMQGKVLLKIKVSHLGIPIHVQVLKSTGHNLLDKMAIKAARSWRFLPIKTVSIGNHYWVEKPIEFKLN
jgi:TonB family protein